MIIPHYFTDCKYSATYISKTSPAESCMHCHAKLPLTTTFRSIFDQRCQRSSLTFSRAILGSMGLLVPEISRGNVTNTILRIKFWAKLVVLVLFSICFRYSVQLWRNGALWRPGRWIEANIDVSWVKSVDNCWDNLNLSSDLSHVSTTPSCKVFLQRASIQVQVFIFLIFIF